MEDNLYSGKFIVIEGLNGCGKSTQIELLKNFQKVVITKEPTADSPAGRKAREVLSRKKKAGPAELQKLFSQDRKHHLHNFIIPNLKQGKTVISDRYFLSSFAFGGLDLNMNWLIKLNNKFLLPDLIFILKTSPQECLKRIEARSGETRIFEEEEKMKKIWGNYEILAKKFKNTHIINGEQPIKKVYKDIVKIINNKI